MSSPTPTPTDPGSLPWQPKYWPVWLGIGILSLLARLPWSFQRSLGRGIGNLLRVLMGSRAKVARRNIELTMPSLSAEQREALVADHFRALGISLFEFSRAWWGSIAPLRKNLQIEGADVLRLALARGKGVILVSGHFTTLEVCGRLLCDVTAVAGMYRPYGNAAMEYAVKKGRLHYATTMFTKTEMRPAVKHLKQGGVLWYAPDQDPSRGDSVFVDFFGVPANSLASTHQLARLSGAEVIFFGHYRTEQGEYRMKLWSPEQPIPSKDAAADTAVVMQAIETMARRAPAQYLWIHRRFKRQPDGRNLYADS